MSASENKHLVQGIFEQLAPGRGQLLIDSMADDIRYTVLGTNAWARTYSGKQTVLGELFRPLVAALGQPPTIVAERLIAEGDTVVVQARGDNITARGERYDNQYCIIMQLAEGRVRAMTEYMDTELVTRVLGDPPQLPR